MTAKSVFKETLRVLTPPILWGAARGMACRLGVHESQPVLFDGPFDSWRSAIAKSDGWDVPAVLDKTLAVSMKQKNGTIVFQQDTITYYHIIYSKSILFFIAMASAMEGGKLNIVDFGGSLGTNFFQNKRVLQEFMKRGTCVWSVVERPPTAELGKKLFQDSNLRFFSSLSELKADVSDYPPSFLFTGSLQYVDDPSALLSEVAEQGVRLIAFDRLLVSSEEHHEIFVQRPPRNTIPPAFQYGVSPGPHS